MTRIILQLFAALFGVSSMASAQPGNYLEHPGRRERNTPGIVLETGARTAACDVLRFTGDGQHLLAAGDDKVVRSWAVGKSGTLSIDALPTLRWPIFRESRGNIYTIALSPDETRVVVAGHGRLKGGFAVAVIERATGKIVHATGNPTDAPQQGTVWASAFSPDGQSVALGTETGAVWLWQLQSDQLRQLGTFALPSGDDPALRRVHCVHFLDDRTILAVAGTGTLQRMSLDAQASKIIHDFQGKITTPAMFSPDNKWLAAIVVGCKKEQRIEIISLLNAEQTQTIRITLDMLNRRQLIPHRLAFSADGRYLALGLREVGNPLFDPTVNFFQERDGKIRIYDRHNLTVPMATLPQPLYAEALAFHPKQSDWLAIAGGNNHDVVLKNWRSGERLGEVHQPARCLWEVRLSKDGNIVSYRDERNPLPTNPNRRGQGRWRQFDLTQRKFLVDAEVPEPSPLTERSPLGWTVLTGDRENVKAEQWHAVSREGKRFPIPFRTVEDEFPRCYCFIPSDATHPERLAVGHYWGISIFNLTDKGLSRERLLRGHEGYVSSIAVHVDKGNVQLISASRDMTLASWTLDDWPYNPRLGVEFFERDGQLRVGKIAPGSPLWEMGLEAGDTIESLFIPDSAIVGAAKAKLIYQHAPTHPVDTPRKAIALLQADGKAGREHLFLWHRPNDPQLYAGLTSVTDRPLWRFFPHGEAEWVLWRWRDYFYDCSTNGDYAIGWQRNHPLAEVRQPDFLKAEQYRLPFHRPEKIAEVLAQGTIPDPLRRFNAIAPPIVTLSEPRLSIGDYVLTVTPKADGPLEAHRPARLLVWVNDCLLNDIELPREQATVNPLSVTIPARLLRNGPNVISAQCYNLGGVRGDSSPRLILHQTTTKPKLHALLIGVSDYRNAKVAPFRLDNIRAATDSEILAEAIAERRGNTLFADIHVETMLNEQATRAGILSRLDQLKSEVEPDDILVFHLGGHGLSPTKLQRLEVPAGKLAGLGQFLFLCPNTDVDRLPTTTISFEELHDKLCRLPCHKLVLLDACHAGEAGTKIDSTTSNPVRIMSQHGIGCIILAACAPDQQAIEDPALDFLGGGNGLFTIALRKLWSDDAIRDIADVNNNAILEADELAASVIIQVRLLVKAHNDQRKLSDQQQPLLYLPRLEQDVPIIGQ